MAEAGAPGAEVVQLGRLVAEIHGSGENLVLLHGNGEDARVFDALIAHLPRFRTIAIEARGHGRTPAGTDPLTIPHLARDLAGALEELGPARAIVLGFSDGANVAMELAVRRPEMMRALVLVGGNLFPAGLRWATRVSLTAGWLGLRVAAVASRRARERAEVWRLMTFEPRISPDALRRITAPTLVVAGEKDMVRLEHSALIARMVRGGELVVVPGVGHFLPTQAPKELGAIIDRFASGLS